MKKKFIKKILIVFLTFISLLFNIIIPVKTAHAQQSYKWYDQPAWEWYLKVYDQSNPQEIFGERYTAAQTQWVLYSTIFVPINLIFGHDTQLVSCIMLSMKGNVADVGTCWEGVSNIFNELSANIETNRLAVNDLSGSLLTEVFRNKQMSGVIYLKRQLTKLSIIPTARAQEQGFGFNAISPLAHMWSISRNFAFAMFSIAIILFSFMIMFRVKINPQTVITVQSALPKLITAMILVTFSFAIAGFMLDLMYIVTALIATIISISGPLTPLGYFNILTGKIVVSSGIMSIFWYFVIYLFLYVLAVAFASLTIATSFTGTTATGILSILLLAFTLILIIILIINWFRVFWMLFKTLAQIYVTVIVGPLQIALGIIVPSAGFSAWIKSLLSKLAVFPVTGIMLWLSFKFLTESFTMSIMSYLDSHPMIERIYWEITNIIENLFGWDLNTMNFEVSVWNPPFLGKGSLPLTFIIISLMCIMILPKIASAIESFMAGKVFDYGTAIGEAFGPFRGAGKLATEAGSRSGLTALAGAMTKTKLYRKLPQRGPGKVVKDFIDVQSHKLSEIQKAIIEKDRRVKKSGTLE